MKKNIFYSLIFFLFLSLFSSCTKSTSSAELIQDVNMQNTPQFFRYDGIGLHLHTMIQWTEDTHSLWRRVYFGNYNDIIIEIEDKAATNTNGQYQYILFDYVQQRVIDTITVNGSSSPLLFYKSRLANTLLLESYEGTQRYKYVYDQGITLINNSEFLSLFNGKYISENPHGNSYIVSYVRHASIDAPHLPAFGIDSSNLPNAWPEGLYRDDNLLNKLNARVFNSGPGGDFTRPTDWKIWDNKYIFMLSSDENSNPSGYRNYYAVRTLDNQLVFTVPQIITPALKYEADPLKANHDTLIDFSADQKRVLLRGMYNNKLCIMIYDIVTYEEWIGNNNFKARRLVLGTNTTSLIRTNSQINSIPYSIEPGTTTLRGVMGTIDTSGASLYERPDINSNVIMQLSFEVMDKYKHYDKDGINTWEMQCFEIIDRSETKTTVNNVEDYWYQIQFDSAANWVWPDSGGGQKWYDFSMRGVFPEMFAEYTGWVFGSHIRIQDNIPGNIIIQNPSF
ncbi:MAG: hypothetical protein FWD28_01870 [Treponema sp.]|nr:hypothetical protein [Treponema sp.]